MSETSNTPNLDLVKPGLQRTADIREIDRNMEKIDTAIGKPSTLKTIKKVVVESINELYDKITNLANDKEPKFTKKGGFNKEKTDSVTTNSSVILATAKAVKTVWDALTSHRNSTTNPHTVTKNQVGLGNVPNYTITDSVGDNSSLKFGSAKGVKTAYDKALNAYNLAVGSPHGIGDYWITESTSNPATKWTGTTWTKLEGRVLLGTSSGYALGAQGGRSTVVLSLANIAAHTHGFSGTTNTEGNHYHQGGNHRHRVDNHAHTQPTHEHNLLLGTNQSSSAAGLRNSGGHGGIGGTASSSTYGTYSNRDVKNRQVLQNGGGANTGGASPYTNYQNPNTSTTGNHNHTVSGTTGSSGSGSAFNIMNPYRVVNIWRRTA